MLQTAQGWNPLFLQVSQRSGHEVPITFQQGKGYSLFCNFVSLCEWKSVIPVKDRALRMGDPVYFRLSATFSTWSKSNGIQWLK